MTQITQLLVVASDDVDLEVAERELRALRGGYGRQTIEFIMANGRPRVKLHVLMRSLGYRVDDHINTSHTTPYDGLYYLAQVERLPQVTLVLGSWQPVDLLAVVDLADEIDEPEARCVVRLPQPDAVPLPDGVTAGGFALGQAVLFHDPFADTPRAAEVIGRGGGWDDMVRIAPDGGAPRQVWPRYLTAA